MTIADAKERIGVPDLWKILELPGIPAKSCHAPWRDDRTPSFSVSSNGKLWNDFATGEGGDAIAFLQRAKGIALKEACREFLRLAGTCAPSPLNKEFSQTVAKVQPYRPSLSRGTDEQLAALSQLRGICVAGLEAAQDAGLLSFGILKGHLSWVLSDSSKRNYQARRLDGLPWLHIGDKKAWTLSGSQAAWPIGILESSPFKTILLCEGGPDLLAAFHFTTVTKRIDLRPVGLLGAGLRIHAEALIYFAGKHVRIFPHIDERRQGYHAAARWQIQLEKVDATVDAFSFADLKTSSAVSVKDLNDCVRMDQQAIAELNLWEGL